MIRKSILSTVILLATITQLQAQNGVGINETGSSPHSSSILDLSSTKAGILIPRMTQTQRNTNISSPATGLLIYQTDNTSGFYYYDGTAWVRVSDAGNGIQSISVNAPITTTGGQNPTLGITQSNTSTNGFLSSTDWNTFNNKQTSALTNGRIWIGNVSNVAQEQLMSGDVTITNTGVATIANNAVTSAKILDGTILNADISATAAIDRTKLANGTANHVLINNASGVMSSEAQLALTRGGTNASLTATAGAVVWSNASQLQLSAAGTSGQVLVSGGTTTPTWAGVGSLLTAGTGISISGNTITNTGVITEVDPTWANGGNQTNSISRSGVVTITRTDATNGFFIGNTGTTAATVSTYPFVVQRAGVTDLTMGSDASYGYLQSWNSKPLLLNSQGNFIGINQTTVPTQNLDINGRLAVQNGVIQRGTSTINVTNDLGLYSQTSGNWIRIASNAAPIKFFTDQGGGNSAGTNATMAVDNANGGGVMISSETTGSGNAGSPQARAALEISSTTKGLLIPRLTSVQRDAMGTTLSEGLLIYNTDNDCIEFWDTKSAPLGGNGFWNSLCEWCQNVVIVNSNQSGFNLNTFVGSARAERYCVYVLSGVTLQSAGNGGGNGAAGNSGFNANTMPSGAKVTLYNYGTILGGGGNGGQGGQESDGVCSGDANGQAGGAGGHGILTSSSVTVRVYNYGTIRAGGGGGGGGGRTCCAAGGGGGGGAGTPAGSGGGGNTASCTSGFICGCGSSSSSGGTAGSALTGGTGGGGVNRGSTACTCTGSGAGTGGTGGTPAVAGTAGGGSSNGAGGAAGFALQGNGSGSSITNISGTVTGSVNP
jgi:hypothetical protein